jgi:hypothetical protein
MAGDATSTAATAAEQLEIETWFATTKSLRPIYWIGLEKSGTLYYWVDGSRVNNGNVSNEDPCEAPAGWLAALHTMNTHTMHDDAVCACGMQASLCRSQVAPSTCSTSSELPGTGTVLTCGDAPLLAW